MADVRLASVAPAPAGSVAYAYTRMGLRVFPLAPGTKRPAIRAWRTRATTDAATVREWWTGEFAGYGVGVATGPESGVWVLDVDHKHGLNGFDALRQLVTEHGGEAALESLARTMAVRTPSGGAHLYFRWDDAAETGGVITKSGHPRPGLDTRGIGGLVHAGGLGGYQIVPDDSGAAKIGIRAAPQWLSELVKRPPRKLPAGGGGGGGGAELVPGTAAAHLAVSGVLERLGGAPRGQRNDALNLAAYRLGSQGLLSEAEAWHECRTIMFLIGAGDSEDAQRRTFLSGWEAGQATRHNSGSINANESTIPGRKATCR